MSDTPRTNAFIATLSRANQYGDSYYDHPEWEEFARTLERELRAAKAELENLHLQIGET